MPIKFKVVCFFFSPVIVMILQSRRHILSSYLLFCDFRRTYNLLLKSLCKNPEICHRQENQLYSFTIRRCERHNVPLTNYSFSPEMSTFDITSYQRQNITFKNIRYNSITLFLHLSEVLCKNYYLIIFTFSGI